MHICSPFTYKVLKKLIQKYGKSNSQIAEEVIEFVSNKSEVFYYESLENKTLTNPKFYGYYSDYDWVAFCWLFGKMIDLPEGFPMYCIDLKQILDEKVLTHLEKWNFPITRFEDGTKKLQEHTDYPKQTNEHDAIADARWNFELYKFLQTIK